MVFGQFLLLQALFTVSFGTCLL